MTGRREAAGSWSRRRSRSICSPAPDSSTPTPRRETRRRRTKTSGGGQLAAMRHPIRTVVVLAGGALALGRVAAQSPPAQVADVGATLIGGNGGAPLRDAVLVVEGARIAQVGPRSLVTIPPGIEQVD